MGETEKGFGTGLRAQLAKKKSEAPPAATPTAAAPAAMVEPHVEHATAGLPDDGAAAAEIEALRAELGAALAREQELRGSLSRQIETVERGESREKLAEREAELVQKAGELSAAGDALDERERRLVEQERELTERSKATETTHGELEALRAQLHHAELVAKQRQEEAEREGRELEARARGGGGRCA